MKVSLLSNLRFYFFLNDLDPDGCLVADQLRACTKTLESTGADKQKSLIPNWRLTLQKKDIIFCDGEVFSLDRGLLMGAIKTTWNRVSFSTYILFLTKLQKRQTRWNGSALLKNDITGSEPTVKMLDTLQIFTLSLNGGIKGKTWDFLSYPVGQSSFVYFFCGCRRFLGIYS